jgi:hypothetical protein
VTPEAAAAGQTSGADTFPLEATANRPRADCGTLLREGNEDDGLGALHDMSSEDAAEVSGLPWPLDRFEGPFTISKSSPRPLCSWVPWEELPGSVCTGA